MFGIGVSEIIVIALVLVVLVKPKEVPGIARKLGGYYKSLMKSVNGVKSEIKKLGDELDFQEEEKVLKDLISPIVKKKK